MKQFNVLERNLSIHQNYLLEASAGTGKTFSIQNIVVRLLLEKPTIPLNKILVVTFTRAATRDLLLRIRKNIEDALSVFNRWLIDRSIKESALDYLQAIIENGDDAVQEARRALQYALFTYDQPSIFTIHSFCSRMLKQYAIEAGMGFHANDGLNALPKSELKQIIRDFFRSGLQKDLYSPAQMTIYLNKDKDLMGDKDKDQKNLQDAISSKIDFESQPTYADLFSQFVQAVAKLKNDLSLSSELLIADFEKQIVNYKAKKGYNAGERLIWIKRFASLFDSIINLDDFEWLITDGLLWNQFLDPANPQSKAALHLDSILNQRIKSDLEPIIEKARDYPTLLVRLATDCSKLLHRYQNEEERIGPDDLLTKMDAALDLPFFADKVRSDFQAAIIDEFQDTDPLQWQIFKKLFLQKWDGYLYLVGDPKQSIYSFRHADIYTYLNAAEALGKESHQTLNVNYRSQPLLVNALNTLFDPRHLPHFMPLPKKNHQLTYRPVMAAPHHLPFHDTRGAVHFFCSELEPKPDEHESKVFFPFIVQEIRRLKKENNFKFSQFAILIRSHYQGKKVAEYLHQFDIPVVNQKGISLDESDALQGLIDLLQAVLHPHDRSAIKIAMGSILIGWTWQDMQGAISYDEPVLLIQRLRHDLIEYGFSTFIENFLHSTWKNDGITVLARLLSQEHGVDIYHDLQQIADLIIEHQFNGWNTHEGLITFLDRFADWAVDEDEKIMRMQDPNKDGVKIITMHYSKGLEFDVVFALGLVSREKKQSLFISLDKGGKIVKIPAQTDSPEWLLHCQECDAEKMRQLYVTLTRAKYQLYIPVILNQPPKVEYGTASPIELFLSRMQQPNADYCKLYERVGFGIRKHLTDFLDGVGKSSQITYSIHSSIEMGGSETAKKDAPLLFKPRTVTVNGEPLIVSSFTGISRHHAISKADHLTPPHDFESPLKQVHTLPANSTTGVFLHGIMEKIDFANWKHFSCAKDGFENIKPFFPNSPFIKWEQPFADLVYNTLKTDLSMQGTSFCLADLNANHLYREMPFLYPCKGVKAIEGLIQENGLIKGIIDLVFTVNGKYYIVDWKSNWLGESIEAYEQQNLHQSMTENSYFLQADIYKEALKRYLRLIEKRPFEECFGGIYYLFMRGIATGANTGIYKID